MSNVLKLDVSICTLQGSVRVSVNPYSHQQSFLSVFVNLISVEQNLMVILISISLINSEYKHLYQFPRAAITKYHRRGGLNNINLFPHCSGGQKSKIKVLAGLVSSEGLFPWLVDGHLFLVSSYGLPSVPVCVLTSSYKDTNHAGLELVHMTSFYLNNLFKGPISKNSHSLRNQRLGLQHMNFRGTQPSP